MESKEARAALDVVAETETRATPPGNAGFAAALALLFGLGVTVTVMDLIWWTLGVMAVLIACVLVWFFRRPGVRDSARQPVDTSTGTDLRRRWPAFFPVLTVPVANLLPPFWWLAVPAGVVIAVLTWWVSLTYRDVYFR